MADWKEIRAGMGRAANKAWKKTGELADTASMHIKLKTLEAKRNEQYELLGKLTYRQLKTGESQAERIAPIIEELDAVRDKIRVLASEIEKAKREREAQKAQKDDTVKGESEKRENETTEDAQ